MKDDKGVYAIARSIWNDPDFEDEVFTQREAWMWLVGAAAWKEVRIRGQRGASLNLARGEFSFSLRFLAEKWGWKKSRVERFLQTLQNRDMIRDAFRDGSQVYFVTNYNEFQVVGLPDRDAEQDGVRDVTGTPSGRHRDKEEALETLEDHSNSAREEKSAPPEWVPREPWDAYLQMRKKIRKPATEYAKKLLIKDLDKWRQLGHDPTTVLNHSTANSYQGLFLPKENGNGRQRHPEKRSSTDQHMAGIADLASELRAKRGAGNC